MVNINKNEDPNLGIDYSRQMVTNVPKALTQQGLYIVGDTGRNLPNTLRHFHGTEEEGSCQLALASMVHAVNLGKAGLTTSHYLVASPDTDRFDTDIFKELAKRNILLNTMLRDLITSPELNLVPLDELARKLDEGLVNLAYFKPESALNITSVQLAGLVPKPNSEFSSTIALPAQKPEMDLTPVS